MIFDNRPLSSDFPTTSLPGSDTDIVPAPYPPSSDDEVLPGVPSDPIPNPEPEAPGLGIPDPGIYEGTLNTASL